MALPSSWTVGGSATTQPVLGTGPGIAHGHVLRCGRAWHSPGLGTGTHHDRVLRLGADGTLQEQQLFGILQTDQA